MYDGFAEPAHSIVSGYYIWWNEPYRVNYDYNTSRDHMRGEGYQALETPDFINHIPQPPVTRIINACGPSYLGSENLFIIFGITLINMNMSHLVFESEHVKEFMEKYRNDLNIITV